MSTPATPACLLDSRFALAEPLFPWPWRSLLIFACPWPNLTPTHRKMSWFPPNKMYLSLLWSLLPLIQHPSHWALWKWWLSPRYPWKLLQDGFIFISRLSLVSLVVTLWPVMTQLTDRNSSQFIFQMISVSVESIWITWTRNNMHIID